MTGILMERIQNKLNQRLAPDMTDKITNPLSDFKTVAEKRAAYNAAVQKGGTFATSQNGDRILLGRPGAMFNDVEFVAGLWRVQNKFSEKITVVRDREFVLLDKLPHQEKTKFEFYNAASVINNCCGRSLMYASPYFIVAKYETNRGTYYSYGASIEQARAFLGIKLYDEYQDLIHAEMTKPKTQRR